MLFGHLSPLGDLVTSSAIIYVLSACLVGVSGGDSQLDHIYDSYPTKSSLPETVPLSPHPQFVYSHSGNVTAILHKTAHLNCRVAGIGNKTVAWIRHKDTHLLTAGRYTYTSDQRFRAIHQVLSQDYLLEISPVKASDGGLYECQISTTPIMSHYVYLFVTDPQTTILGGPALYFSEGDTINITCLVKDSPEPPNSMHWYHGDKIISYSSPRGGISQITEKGDTTASFLIIQGATSGDSGEYTCSPSNGNKAYTTLHVIQGKDPALLVTSHASQQYHHWLFIIALFDILSIIFQ